MKFMCVIILLLGGAFCVNAQRFVVMDNDKTIEGTIGERLVVPVQIRNISDQPLQIVFQRQDKMIGTSQHSYFCWDSECFDETVEKLPLSKRINPGESSAKFRNILETGLAAGFSTVTYLIYDRDNPSDAVEYTVNFEISEREKKPSIFESGSIRINDVYPNPVSDYAIIDYNLNNSEVKAKVVIHNVLGSVMSEIELPYLETKARIRTEELNAGVYFYTLYLDNDGVMTRKLIVRK